jgi:hypothetical protein
MALEIKVDVKIANYRDIIKLAADDMAKSMLLRAQLDIASVGRRFIKGIRVPVKRITGGYDVQILQTPAYGKVYEFGGVSKGKAPSGMLWIPLQRGRRTRAKKRKGKLFRPRGRNVLMNRKTGKVEFIGVPSVTHQRRTHLRRIASEEAAKFSQRIKQLIRV